MLASYRDKAFSKIAPRLWKSLPEDLRKMHKIIIFQQKPTYLFILAFQTYIYFLNYFLCYTCFSTNFPQHPHLITVSVVDPQTYSTSPYPIFQRILLAHLHFLYTLYIFVSVFYLPLIFHNIHTSSLFLSFWIHRFISPRSIFQWILSPRLHCLYTFFTFVIDLYLPLMFHNIHTLSLFSVAVDPQMYFSTSHLSTEPLTSSIRVSVRTTCPSWRLKLSSDPMS